MSNIKNIFYEIPFSSIFILHEIFISLVKIICLLIAIAYFTLAERKVMAAIQRRKGPNVVGWFGLLQPIADGLKLLAKEMVIPTAANSGIFILAPMLILLLSLVSWSVVPFGIQYITEINSQLPHLLTANIHYSILFIVAISSLNVYGLIIAGWASNSKYAFLGALRSAAQMISYEVSIGLVILPVVLLAGSLNFVQIIIVQEITGWFIFPLLPCAIIFFISMLAETNRTPFDLTEAEAELVAGYNTEYSSIIFAMFFLAEYSNMILMSAVFSILFLGGWLAPAIITSLISQPIILSAKITILCFFFILVRATFPRYRYDQLMTLGWKVFLPVSLGYLVFVASILLISNTFILIV